MTVPIGVGIMIAAATATHPRQPHLRQLAPWDHAVPGSGLAVGARRAPTRSRTETATSATRWACRRRARLPNGVDFLVGRRARAGGQLLVRQRERTDRARAAALELRDLSTGATYAGKITELLGCAGAIDGGGTTRNRACGSSRPPSRPRPPPPGWPPCPPGRRVERPPTGWPTRSAAPASWPGPRSRAALPRAAVSPGARPRLSAGGCRCSICARMRRRFRGTGRGRPRERDSHADGQLPGLARGIPAGTQQHGSTVSRRSCPDPAWRATPCPTMWPTRRPTPVASSNWRAASCCTRSTSGGGLQVTGREGQPAGKSVRACPRSSREPPSPSGSSGSSASRCLRWPPAPTPRSATSKSPTRNIAPRSSAIATGSSTPRPSGA